MNWQGQVPKQVQVYFTTKQWSISKHIFLINPQQMTVRMSTDGHSYSLPDIDTSGR